MAAPHGLFELSLRLTLPHSAFRWHLNVVVNNRHWQFPGEKIAQKVRSRLNCKKTIFCDSFVAFEIFRHRIAVWHDSTKFLVFLVADSGEVSERSPNSRRRPWKTELRPSRLRERTSFLNGRLLTVKRDSLLCLGKSTRCRGCCCLSTRLASIFTIDDFPLCQKWPQSVVCQSAPVYSQNFNRRAFYGVPCARKLKRGPWKGCAT